MIISESKKSFRWIAIAILAVVALVAAVGIFLKIWNNNRILFSFGQSDYVISGVPYIGIYNHTGKFNQFSGDKDSAIASVLEYWQPGENDLGNIRAVLAKKEIKPLDMANFVNGISGMKAELKILKLEELGNYISPQARTPLVAFFAVDENQPAENHYYPSRVLIGVKEIEQKLVFHDFWLGNNFEISFDEYGKLLAKTPPVLRNKYLAIQPVDLVNKLSEIKKRQFSSYPARTEIMNGAKQMFKNYALAWSPYQDGQYDLAESYYTKVINDPNFEKFFPPEYKVRVYAQLAEMQLGKKDLENAMVNVQKSIAMNHDLDKPFRDWPGYELSNNAPGHFSENSISYRVQGDIYLATGDFEKAKESYQKALVIKPNNPLAKAGLAAAEGTISKK